MVSVNTIGRKIDFFYIIRLNLVNDTTTHVSAENDRKQSLSPTLADSPCEDHKP